MDRDTVAVLSGTEGRAPEADKFIPPTFQTKYSPPDHSTAFMRTDSEDQP